MAHRNGLALVPVHHEVHDAREVLPKVIDQLVAHLGAAHGAHELVGANGGAVLGEKGRAHAQGLARGGAPGGVIQAHAGVVGLAVVEAGHAAGSILGDLPVLASTQGLRCAIRILHAHLKE